MLQHECEIVANAFLFFYLTSFAITRVTNIRF